jgi:transcriptional regulator with XRE-family HTH domain
MSKTAPKPLSKEEVLLRFGRAVYDLRMKSELTQEELADRCGMHVTYISQIERGLKNLSLFNIHRLTEALRASPTDLITGTNTHRSSDR